METDKSAHRLLLTAASPEKEVHQAASIMHDARNKVSAMMMDFEYFQIMMRTQEFNSYISELRVACDTLTRLSESFKENDTLASFSSHFENLGSLARSLIPVFENLKSEKPEVLRVKKDSVEAATALMNLMEASSRYIHSSEYPPERLHFINFSEAIGSLVASYQRRYPDIRFEFHAKENIYGSSYVERLMRAIENILNNAVQALPEQGGCIVVDINRKVIHTDEKPFPEVDEGHYVSVEITDNGSGMSEALLEQIPCHFFTTKEDGVGLGLTSIRQTVQSHKGHLVIESEEGRGTKVTTLIPSTIPPASGPRFKDTPFSEDEMGGTKTG